MIELKDVAGLSEPATKLLDIISNAIGGLAKPWQIVRTAKAEAKAEIVKAKTAMAISNIERRALKRFVNEEIQKQTNIESISHLALRNISSNAQPDKIDHDWIVNFFDKCRIISNDDMQRLWASVLSSEANRPGSFSRRTVNLISELSNKDAELFESLCSYCFDVGFPFPFVHDIRNDIYKTNGITHASVLHLQSLGLVSYDAWGVWRESGQTSFTMRYFENAIIIEFINPEKTTFSMGEVMLTPAGVELFTVCSPVKVYGLFEYVVGCLQRRISQSPGHFKFQIL